MIADEIVRLGAGYDCVVVHCQKVSGIFAVTGNVIARVGVNRRAVYDVRIFSGNAQKCAVVEPQNFKAVFVRRD